MMRTSRIINIQAKRRGFLGNCLAASAICLLTGISVVEARDTIDLAGKWKFALDTEDRGVELNDTITLPGTTDLAQKGIRNTLKPALTKPQLSYLTRKYSYIGVAWYEKEVDIPSDWQGKTVLELERVLWRSEVWVNGQKVGDFEESLITPHRFDVSELLKPGQRNTIRIRIDNRQQHDISAGGMAHAYTDHTQIKWNGALGKICLIHSGGFALEDVQTYPAEDMKSLTAEVDIYAEQSGKKELMVTFRDPSGQVIKQEKRTIAVDKGLKSYRIELTDLKDVRAWDEFHPNLYQLSISSGGEEISETLGFRRIKRVGKTLTINNRPLFLRGTLDCCIFPLTGTPPMDEKGWAKWLGTLRQWGINHVRFHSWCPPEAAFDVADKLGMYFQVELPLWQTNISKETPYIGFLRDEGNRLFKEYGNHPSFVMFTLGNELQRDFDVLGNLLKDIKRNDGRQLYATTSFTFEGGHGDYPEPADDFLVTQWTKQGWVRGQGVFNQEPPAFNKTYDKAAQQIPVPIVTHEIGQYSVYPDITEIPKYTGVLTPLNFMAVREDLEKKGLLDKAPAYLKATGRFAEILYKEEIERAMKTQGISGFQLLSLSDFSGQGTALVGLLNAFGESKGVTTPEHFRQFNAPVVPLACFSKAVYTNNESFQATLDLANYGEHTIPAGHFHYQLANEQGKVVAMGTVKHGDMPVGYNKTTATIDIPLQSIDRPSHLVLTVSAENTRNTWSIWVYPEAIQPKWGKVKYTRLWSEASKLLRDGEIVLYNPDYKKLNGVEGKFVPVFWSPVHFPKQAGTMGILCDPKHPALASFPTDMHSDWQWWDLCVHATTMVMDPVRGGEPVVEMIDNFVNNRRLALAYEGSVGSGKLMVVSMDLASKLNERPAARQMLVSLLDYMNSGRFQPKAIENPETFQQMLRDQGETKQSKPEDIY